MTAPTASAHAMRAPFSARYRLRRGAYLSIAISSSAWAACLSAAVTSRDALPTHQQPAGDGGADTPGVTPVEFAGVIMPGLARSIVMLSAQAEVFGVGITLAV